MDQKLGINCSKHEKLRRCTKYKSKANLDVCYAKKERYLLRTHIIFQIMIDLEDAQNINSKLFKCLLCIQGKTSIKNPWLRGYGKEP